LIETGDESHDQVLVPSVNGDSGPPAMAVGPGATNGVAAETVGTPAVAAMPSSGEVREFFSQLKISRQATGGVIIEAPAEAAATLGALFEGMAALLQNVTRAGG
jgi:hypothetical protein